MSYNLEYKTHGKVGEIIYPAYNGTNSWFKKSRWDIIIKVDKEGLILDREFIWKWEIVRTLEILKHLEEIKRLK